MAYQLSWVIWGGGGEISEKKKAPKIYRPFTSYRHSKTSETRIKNNLKSNPLKEDFILKYLLFLIGPTRVSRLCNGYETKLAKQHQWNGISLCAPFMRHCATAMQNLIELAKNFYIYIYIYMTILYKVKKKKWHINTQSWLLMYH